MKQQSAVAFAPSRVHPELPQKSANCYLWASGPNLSAQTSANTTPSALSSHILASYLRACSAKTGFKVILAAEACQWLPLGHMPRSQRAKRRRHYLKVRPAHSALPHDFLLVLICISSAIGITSEIRQQLPLGDTPQLNMHSHTDHIPEYALPAHFPLLLPLLALSSALLLIRSACSGVLHGKAFMALLKLRNARGGEECRSCLWDRSCL